MSKPSKIPAAAAGPPRPATAGRLPLMYMSMQELTNFCLQVGEPRPELVVRLGVSSSDTLGVLQIGRGGPGDAVEARQIDGVDVLERVVDMRQPVRGLGRDEIPQEICSPVDPPTARNTPRD